MRGSEFFGRRALLGKTAAALAVPAAVLLSSLVGGCGWEPLYADPQTAPANADLRAIRVAPIPERVGQRLEMALRRSFNPLGEPAPAPPPRYVLHVTVVVSQQNQGLLTQGLGTRGRTDLYASFILLDSKSGAQVLTGASHAADSFDLLASGYSNVVAMDDSLVRSVDVVRNDLVTRLTLFMQRREAPPPIPAKT